ncbi:MAG: hypothetical protein LQ340_001635 [Diploschistes diacapsis]|nr:MAG: hypothetical protein LQ340_001635 [Diploschistes diacapsis]
MSSWRSYLPGRYSSPFSASSHHGSRPTVTEDDYHYLGPEDIVEPPRARNDTHFSHLTRHGSRADADNPEVPDILVLKHRGTTYPLHFPAYSIGEGVLRVGQLRRYAATQTNTADPRRIKLFYKGKTLKDDAVACREEGLKQNSELMCVVSEVPVTNRRGESSESSADEEDLVGGHRDGPRVDVDGTIIGGPERKKRSGHRDGSKKILRAERDDHYGGGSDYGPSTQSHRSSTPHVSSANNHHPSTPTSVPKEKEPYRPHATGPSSEPKVPPATESHTSPKQPAAAGPKTPMDKLEELASTFHTKFVPLCLQFTNNPPKDSKVRGQEYMKLSESILTQILLKLDDVDTEGNDDARKRRKAQVKEAQDVLSDLDAVQRRQK